MSRTNMRYNRKCLLCQPDPLPCRSVVLKRQDPWQQRSAKHRALGDTFGHAVNHELDQKPISSLVRGEPVRSKEAISWIGQGEEGTRTYTTQCHPPGHLFATT